MKFLLALILTFTSISAFAHRTNDPAPFHPILQRMIGAYGNSNPGDHVLRFVKATYDASIQGGGTTSSYYTPAWLPKNSVIVRSFIEILTQQTSAGVAPVTKISCANSGDILNSNIKASSSGFVEGLSLDTAASFASKASADCHVKVDIVSAAGQGLSTGKFGIYLWYIQGS